MMMHDEKKNVFDKKRLINIINKGKYNRNDLKILKEQIVDTKNGQELFKRILNTKEIIE